MLIDNGAICEAQCFVAFCTLIHFNYYILLLVYSEGLLTVAIANLHNIKGCPKRQTSSKTHRRKTEGSLEADERS